MKSDSMIKVTASVLSLSLFASTCFTTVSEAAGNGRRGSGNPAGSPAGHCPESAGPADRRERSPGDYGEGHDQDHVPDTFRPFHQEGCHHSGVH